MRPQLLLRVRRCVLTHLAARAGERDASAIRPVALAGAAVIAVGLSGMRVVFGRHFLTDVVFGGVVTLLIIVLCQRLILRLDDARIEAP